MAGHYVNWREDDYRIDVQFKTIGFHPDSGIDISWKLASSLKTLNTRKLALTHLSITPLSQPPYHASRILGSCGERRARNLIVDQFTGRTMEGQRFDGLHRSLKPEKVCQSRMKPKHFTSITLPKPSSVCTSRESGMTGTGKTEEEEFREI